MTFTTTTVGAVSCAATDVIIAASLSWKFWTMMAGTARKASTRSLIRRILILTVSSGAICAGNTLLMMILLLRGSEFFEFFFSCQGRVYALTLLGNFLVGIPGRTPNNSARMETSFSNNVVVFRTVGVETTVDATPKSILERPVRSQNLNTPYDNHDCDSVQLDDLTLAQANRKSKRDPERDWVL
ncbi:hypothetical protein B0H14DRAFT_1079331 [Mycena olivaceomarginata]|nr:hypothetical protein B0H14DRAFT_1079331 [Mycena olivaceomarginata]